ncbi:MAG: glycoside hydrolase family 13 protein [Bacteroidales bacterium]
MIEKIEPPFWWSGMKSEHIQLMIYGKELTTCQASLDSGGVKVTRNYHPSENYLFIDLSISPTAKPGKYHIRLDGGPAYQKSLVYELKERRPGSAQRKGLTTADAIYLLMPDRFSNGDPANDNMPGMTEQANRNNPDGRHGGDIKGIVNFLDDINKMGFTALWINPLLENNMPKYSYHGYAITDFYKTDPRLGSNEDYCDMVNQAHKQGLKVIMDMVFNHFGSGHIWMNDLPDPNWINHWPEFTRSNYRAGVITDPYVSETDKIKMQKGWFDTTMPDFDQTNPHVADYLIQNSIWWVEYANLDGIRMDTYPYSDEEFMRKWMQRITLEYPEFFVVGECWLNTSPSLSYWLQNSPLSLKNSSLTNIFDFPLAFALQKAFVESEGWETGSGRLYDLLSQDFLYTDPDRLVTFVDNHDIDRMASMLKTKENVKMAIAFLATTRGIPLFYYGSEIMMKGFAGEGHGTIRKDYPGGWINDTIDIASGKGLTKDESEVRSYLSKILNWRLHNPAVQKGKLKHFIPEDGIYVYFRTLPNQAIMVICNNNESVKTLSTSRFKEVTDSFKRFKDIENQQNIDIKNQISLSPKSVRIIELYK